MALQMRERVRPHLLDAQHIACTHYSYTHTALVHYHVHNIEAIIISKGRHSLDLKLKKTNNNIAYTQFVRQKTKPMQFCTENVSNYNALRSVSYVIDGLTISIHTHIYIYIYSHVYLSVFSTHNYMPWHTVVHWIENR